MKLHWMLAAVVALALSLPAHGRMVEEQDVDRAQPRDVQVQLQAEQSFVPATEDVRVMVTFVNTGREAAALARWFVPGDEFDDPVFEVTLNGQPVAFMGPLVKRAPPAAEDLVWLQPGEQMAVPVELSGTYDLSAGGEYSVRYRAASAHLYGSGQTGIEVLASNAVAIDIEGRQYSNVRALAGDGYKAAGGSNVSFTGRCSATQQSQLLSAVSAASTMSGAARTYLAGTPSGTPRYTMWFGAFTTARWNTAKGHFDNIYDAFQTKPLTLDCSCKKSYYAYVYPTQPYKIYVCKVFWSAPMTGTDSKGGTLIHEMSHFNVVAATDDWAYGQSAARSLALSNPTRALDNADSHEYFAENTPEVP